MVGKWLRLFIFDFHGFPMNLAVICCKWRKLCSKIVSGRMPYYAVARGRSVGVFGSWAECEAQVKGHSGARYKKFDTEQLARAFVAAEGGLGPAVPLSTAARSKGPSSAAAPAPRAVAARAPLKRKASEEQQVCAELDRLENRLRVAAASTDRVIQRGKKAVLLEPQEARGVAQDEWQVDAEGFVRVWTDGSCLSNGRRGARAGLGVWWGPRHKDNESAPVARATNNSGELLAAARALRTASLRGLKRVAVHSDSQYLVRACTQWLPGWRANGWRRANNQPLLNIAEFQELDDAWHAGLEVKWVHVPGHAGHVGNEAADALARAGALMAPLTRDQDDHSTDDDDDL